MRSFSVSRFFFGEDIFISYARRDAMDYALSLAIELQNHGLTVFVDQFDTLAGQEIPKKVIRALDRSSMLVVVGSDAAKTSVAIEEEIQRFQPKGRKTFVINVNNNLFDANWYSLIEGLPPNKEDEQAFKNQTPSAKIVEGITKSFAYSRQKRRLRISIFAVIATIVGMSLSFVGYNSFLKKQSDADLLTSQYDLKRTEIMTNIFRDSLEDETNKLKKIEQELKLSFTSLDSLSNLDSLSRLEINKLDIQLAKIRNSFTEQQKESAASALAYSATKLKEAGKEVLAMKTAFEAIQTYPESNIAKRTLFNLFYDVFEVTQPTYFSKEIGLINDIAIVPLMVSPDSRKLVLVGQSHVYIYNYKRELIGSVETAQENDVFGKKTIGYTPKGSSEFVVVLDSTREVGDDNVVAMNWDGILEPNADKIKKTIQAAKEENRVFRSKELEYGDYDLRSTFFSVYQLDSNRISLGRWDVYDEASLNYTLIDTALLDYKGKQQNPHFPHHLHMDFQPPAHLVVYARIKEGGNRRTIIHNIDLSRNWRDGNNWQLRSELMNGYHFTEIEPLEYIYLDSLKNIVMMDKTKGTSKIIFEQKENYWADYGEYSSDSYHDLYCLDDKLIYIYSSHFVVLRRDGEILYEFDLEYDRFKNTKLNSHYLVGYTMRGKIFSIDLNSYQMDEKITKGAMEQGDLCNEYLVASFSYDKIKAWDYDGNELWIYPKNQSVDLIKLSPSGKYVMFLFSRELRILNKEQQLLSTVKSAVGYSEYSPKITFTPNEKYFFVERSNFTIDLYNIQGDKIYTFIGSNLTIPKNSDHFFYIGKDSGYYSVKRFLLPSKINQWYLNGGFNDYMNQRIYE